MSLTAPTRVNGYLIAHDQEATREFFQSLFSDIHERLTSMELTKADYEDAVNLITTQALASVSATIGQEIADQRNVLAEIQTNAEAVLRAYEEISLSGVPARTIRVDTIDGLKAKDVQAALNAIWLRKISTDLLEDTAVTFAKQAHVPTARLIGRRTADEGPQEALTAAQAKEVLGKYGNSDLADMPAATIKGRKSTADGAPEDLSAADVMVLLAPIMAGEVVKLPAATIPAGRRLLKLNGAQLSRAAYPHLFAYAGLHMAQSEASKAANPGLFGPGNGSTTFTIPDWRGYFIRAWDDGRGVDSGRTIWQIQDSMNRYHAHAASTSGAGGHSHGVNDPGHDHYYERRKSSGGLGYRQDSAATAAIPDAEGLRTSRDGTGISIQGVGDHAHGVTVAADGGNEARPINLAALFAIRF